MKPSMPPCIIPPYRFKVVIQEPINPYEGPSAWSQLKKEPKLKAEKKRPRKKVPRGQAASGQSRDG